MDLGGTASRVTTTVPPDGWTEPGSGGRLDEDILASVVEHTVRDKAGVRGVILAGHPTLSCASLLDWVLPHTADR